MIGSRAPRVAPPILVVAFVVLAAGCAAVGPDFRAPALPAHLDAKTSLPFAEVGSAALDDAPLPPRWWRLYADPRLDELVEEALRANTDLRVAVAHIDRAEAVVRETQAAAGVQTSIGGSVTANRTSRLGLGEAAPTTGLFDAGLGISYEVDIVGRIRRALEAARADAQAQAAAYDLARTTIVAGVVGAYSGVCATGAQLIVARRSIDLQSRSLGLTERGEAAGLYAGLDSTRSRALVAQLEAAVPPLEATRRTAMLRLGALLGRAPDALPAIADCERIPTIARALPVGDGIALIRRRPDIRQAERELASATAGIGVATADLYPRVMLGASVGSTAQTIAGLTHASALGFGIGPAISWQFPNTRIAHARIDEANASTRAALARFDGTVLTALRESETALGVYVRDLEQNEKLRVARDESKRAEAILERTTRGGLSSSLDLLDAQRTLASAESALAQSDATVAADRVQVFLTLGGGWEPDRGAAVAAAPADQ